ncbi:MAG TPA: AAA family ATPase, partial [Trueperaceae bacterium]|nr:AAA family ATPase [Trueperaceae bacterium]
MRVRSTRRLVTLGALSVDGSDYARTKPLALLAHLCLEGPQSRRRLASLFWPGAADPLNQLSLTLSRLGKDLPGAFSADAKSVEAQVDCDAVLVRASVAEGDIERASSLYGGEFLHGLSVPAISSELREWIEDTRDDLARSLQHALLNYAARVARDGSRDGAASLVRRAVKVRDVSLLDADDLLFAHDALLWARDPSAQRFRVEAEDLGLEFKAGLSAAAARMRESHTRSARPAMHQSHAEGARTRLIGRHAELELLHDLLVVDQHRLVTITGPGGIGKSLLAAAAADAALASGAFPGGIVHVACDGLESPSDVARAAIEALGATPPAAGVGPEHLTAELVLRSGTLLLLDDFDHHADHAWWLPKLLRAAPGTTVLVSANQPVGSANEHVLPLSGLSATGHMAGEVGALFQERARRADASYELTTEDVPSVAELGRLTGGNPLALELAAAWVAVVPVAEIVRELA